MTFVPYVERTSDFPHRHRSEMLYGITRKRLPCVEKLGCAGLRKVVFLGHSVFRNLVYLTK